MPYVPPDPTDAAWPFGRGGIKATSPKPAPPPCDEPVAEGGADPNSPPLKEGPSKPARRNPTGLPLPPGGGHQEATHKASNLRWHLLAVSGPPRPSRKPGAAVIGSEGVNGVSILLLIRPSEESETEGQVLNSYFRRARSWGWIRAITRIFINLQVSNQPPVHINSAQAALK